MTLPIGASLCAFFLIFWLLIRKALPVWLNKWERARFSKEIGRAHV